MTDEPDEAFRRFIHAVTTEDLATMERMLADGFDVNTSNDQGETPFSYACTWNKLESARFLHARGADINTVDTGGGTPRDWAIQHASLELQHWLASVGAKFHDWKGPDFAPPRYGSDDEESEDPS